MTRFPPRGAPPRRLVAGAVRYKIHPVRFLSRCYRPPLLEARHWWAVLVFPSREALHAYGEWRGCDGARDFAGIVMPMETLVIRPGKPDRLRSKLGEILLWRERIGASVVSHENLHAALATLRMTGPEDMLRLTSEDVYRDLDREERLCYLLGAIDRQVVAGLYRYGVLAD